MSYIKEIEPEYAENELAEVYGQLLEKRGKVSNILKVHSLNPRAMQKHLELYMSIMFRRGGIKRPEAEMLAAFVSALNKCEYCINHHAEALKRYWKDDERVEALIDDYSTAGLDSRQLALLRFAEVLTQAPENSHESEIARLRDAGLDDSEILDITLIIAYFNFVNRIALGLGVEFSKEEITGYKV